MSTAAVQQFFARCAVDAAFLEAAQADLDASLAGYELTEEERADFAALDLARVRTFVGLVTKVQNNGLWQTFPDTRRLLDRYGLDLRVFADYSAQHQIDRSARSVYQTDRALHFAAFLTDWVTTEGASRWPGLLDVLHHERMWFEQRLALADPAPQPPADVSSTADTSDDALDRAVVATRGLVLVDHFTYNPAEVVRAVRADAPVEALTPRPRLLAYWGDRSAMALRIFEVDTAVGSLLCAIDGETPLDALFARLLGPASTPANRDVLRGAVRDMVATGVLAVVTEA